MTEWIVPQENPAGAVYGLLVIAALLAAESGSHETFLETVSSTVIAAASFWLVHAYATVLGRRLSAGEHLRAQTLLRALGHDYTLLRGAAVPIAALLVAWAAGASQQTAVTFTLWCAIAALVGFELLAALRTRARGRELALEAGVGLLLGVAVLAMKIVLH